MTVADVYPRNIVLAAALGCGVLLALAVHMLGQGIGLDLGGLLRVDGPAVIPIGPALAWWLIAAVGFGGGYFTARLMDGTTTGQLPRGMWQLLAFVLVLILSGTGLSASAPSTGPILVRVAAGVVALLLGGCMAFCGARFATRGA